MMILSSFRDYYDSCASHGVDMTVQYRRDPKEYDLRLETGLDGVMIKEFNCMIKSAQDRLAPIRGHIPLVFIGFCGKVYVGLRTKVEWHSGRIYREALNYGNSKPEPRTTLQTMWDARDVHEEDLDEEFEEYRFYRDKGQKTIRDWMDEKGLAPVGGWIDLFQRHHAVAFVIYKDTLTINPCLQDYKFQRVIGGVDAFQMIEGFISGVLGVSANPMIELTDKDRVQAHGFNEKSFRKEPTKRV